MHQLRRGKSPSCLSRYRHGRDNWDTPSIADKHEIRDCLSAMQGAWCAYCESFMGSDWHIEHLWPRDHHSQRTFDWDNLFASCNRRETYGKYKDTRGRPYSPEDLIDPCREDPDNFLIFAADGTVQPRADLKDAGLRRATTTIRVFNLNYPVLKLERSLVINTLMSSEPDIESFLAELTAEERSQWIADLIQDYCKSGFETPVRHLLCEARA